MRLTKAYIIHQQKQLENKRRREAELEAKKEAERVAKMEAEAREREEIAARKKLLLEQERLRQEYTQKKEELEEQKWSNQLDTLLDQIEEDRIQREDNRLEEIRIIIQNREPSLQELDWANWLTNPLNQALADLDFDHAMEMFKRDNLLAKRRKGTGGRRRKVPQVVDNYALAFSGDVESHDGAWDHVTTTFDPMDYELYNGFTVSYWVRPDELTGSTYYFALARKAFGPTSRFEFGITNATKIFIGVGTQRKIAALHGMSVGNWYHWVFTFAGGTNGELIAYRNGEDIDLPSYGAGQGTSTWGSSGDTDVPIYFGGRDVSSTPNYYDNGWACALDEVAIFNEVKDSDWVTSTYNNGAPTDLQGQSGLVGYWKFNEGSGTTVKDYSGNDNHGTFAPIGTINGPSEGVTTAYPTWEKVKVS
jgi:hypothetical protein